ncbi:hypothetical protein KBC55_03590 [Patescibacteria group bacterium]|nr:hypothetical protein [Patescibacteria group bacterium]
MATESTGDNRRIVEQTLGEIGEEWLETIGKGINPMPFLATPHFWGPPARAIAKRVAKHPNTILGGFSFLGAVAQEKLPFGRDVNLIVATILRGIPRLAENSLAAHGVTADNIEQKIVEWAVQLAKETPMTTTIESKPEAPATPSAPAFELTQEQGDALGLLHRILEVRLTDAFNFPTEPRRYQALLRRLSASPIAVQFLPKLKKKEIDATLAHLRTLQTWTAPNVSEDRPTDEMAAQARIEVEKVLWRYMRFEAALFAHDHHLNGAYSIVIGALDRLDANVTDEQRRQFREFWERQLQNLSEAGIPGMTRDFAENSARVIREQAERLFGFTVDVGRQVFEFAAWAFVGVNSLLIAGIALCLMGITMVAEQTFVAPALLGLLFVIQVGIAGRLLTSSLSTAWKAAIVIAAAALLVFQVSFVSALLAHPSVLLFQVGICLMWIWYFFVGLFDAVVNGFAALTRGERFGRDAGTITRAWIATRNAIIGRTVEGQGTADVPVQFRWFRNWSPTVVIIVSLVGGVGSATQAFWFGASGGLFSALMLLGSGWLTGGSAIMYTRGNRQLTAADKDNFWSLDLRQKYAKRAFLVPGVLGQVMLVVGLATLFVPWFKGEALGQQVTVAQHVVVEPAAKQEATPVISTSDAACEKVERMLQASPDVCTLSPGLKSCATAKRCGLLK